MSDFRGRPRTTSKRRNSLRRWLILLAGGLVIAASAVFWLVSGQGPVAAIISVVFTALGLIFSFYQLVPAEKSSHLPVATALPPPTQVAIHTPRRPSSALDATESPLSRSHTLRPVVRPPQGGLHVAVPLVGVVPPRAVFEPPMMDWGEAPDIRQLHGRDEELTCLRQWIIVDRCHLLAMLGMGGIGKTSLAAALAQQVKGAFDYVFWRSLQHAPPLSSILRDCVECIAGSRESDFPEDSDAQIALLLRYLREYRCLIILDNMESVLQEQSRAGMYRPGYEGYGELLRRVGESEHQSCLILTSREKPGMLTRLEGTKGAVRSLSLAGLNEADASKLLSEQGLEGNEESWSALIQRFSGNPLALKLAAASIRELYGGDSARFLAQGETVFGDVQALLNEQFARLSAPEQAVMYWLAIEREATSVDTLLADLALPPTKGTLLEWLVSLRRRSLIETRNDASFGLLPVIMEYVTQAFVEQVVQEIEAGAIALCGCYALIKAQAKEYTRDAQMRSILAPVASRLCGRLGKEGSEHTLKNLLAMLRAAPGEARYRYAAGNILNMLLHLQGDVRGLDFSSTTLRQAYLRGATLPEVNFAHADLAGNVFTETFGNILCVALSPCEDVLAASTVTGAIHLWRVPDGTPLLTLQGHSDWVRSVSFSPDGSTLLSGSDDQSACLWDVKTGDCRKVLLGHKGRVYAVAFAPDGQTVASGGDDCTIRLWDASDGQPLGSMEGHAERIRSLAFSPGGNLLASGGEDGTVRLWNSQTSQPLATLPEQSSHIYTVAFNHDGTMLAGGGGNCRIYVWNIDVQGTAQHLHTLSGQSGNVYSVAFNSSGSCLASAGDEQVIRLWDVQSGQGRKLLHGHHNRVRALAFARAGDFLVSGGSDQSLRFWDTGSGHCLVTLHGYSSWVYAVAYSPEGDILAHDCEDHSVRLWSLAEQRYIKTLRGHQSWLYALAFSADGSLLASGSDDHTIKLWERESGACVRTLHGHAGRVRCVAFSPCDRILASGSDDRSVRLWDVQTGVCLRVMEGNADRVRSVAFNMDGSMLVSGGDDQCLRLWDTQTGACLKTLQTQGGRVWSTIFDPAGTLLASGGDDAAIHLWDVNSGECQQILTGHCGRVYALAFTPDGQRLVSGSEDATVRVWDVGSGECLLTLKGHNARVRAVAVDPAGLMLASGSHDGTVRLWNLRNGECRQTLRNDKPYERMNITGARGLTAGQRAMLKELGAVEDINSKP